MTCAIKHIVALWLLSKAGESAESNYSAEIFTIEIGYMSEN